ncbi:MAG: hypothetical protein ACYDHN_06790 [Solirubrobacteraceae bacterium]
MDTPDAWAVEHVWLLEAVFNLFDRDGEWPRVASVQRALADIDPVRAVAVAQLAIDIPSELGARSGECLTLTTKALTYCEGAGRLLSLFVKVIQAAVAEYRASDDDRVLLSGFAVKNRLDIDDRTYAKLSILVFREPWFFGSGGGNPDDDWHFEVRTEVLLAENIENVHDYLDVVARYRFGPPEIESPLSERSKRGLADVVGGWLTKRDVNVRDLLLIAIGSAVVAGVVLWLLLG